MPPLRPLLLGLVLAAAGCAATPGQPTIFDHTGVHHPEALFDVATRSAQLRQVTGGSAKRKGEQGAQICVRASDVPDYGPLIGPSLAAVRGGGDTNNDARDMARALNASAFYILYQNDEARARQDVAVLRRHADANLSGVRGRIVSVPARSESARSAVATKRRRSFSAWPVMPTPGTTSTPIAASPTPCTPRTKWRSECRSTIVSTTMSESTMRATPSTSTSGEAPDG